MAYNYKHMKKFIIAGLMALIVATPLFQGNFVSAQTSARPATAEELTVQINSLLRMVDDLRLQLAKLQSATTTVAVPQFCYTFNTDLRIGSTGPDVTALHTALSINLKGMINATELARLSGNVFTSYTAAAVKFFQEKYRSEILNPAELTAGSGFVGAMTRAKLNGLYKCSTVSVPITVTTPSITVVSPNGGESLAIGVPVEIKWTTNIAAAEQMGVSLVDQNGITVKTLAIATDSNPFSWKPTSDLVGKQLRVKVKPYNTSIAANDTSNTYFTIAAIAPTPLPPPPTTTSTTYNGQFMGQTNVITRLTPGQAFTPAITMWNTGSETWRKGDYAVKLGTLSPKDNFTWGTNRIYLPRDVAPNTGVTFETPLTAPKTPGQYTFQWQLVNDDGKTGWFGQPSMAMTITVAASTLPSVTVSSPNGGEIFYVGVPVRISWTTANISSAEQVGVSLVDQNGVEVKRLAIATPDNPFTWTPTSDLVGKQLKVRVKPYNSTINASDTSDGYFAVRTSTNAASDSLSLMASTLDAIQALINSIKASLTQ